MVPCCQSVPSPAVPQVAAESDWCGSAGQLVQVSSMCGVGSKGEFGEGIEG